MYCTQVGESRMVDENGDITIVPQLRNVSRASLSACRASQSNGCLGSCHGLGAAAPSLNAH